MPRIEQPYSHPKRGTDAYTAVTPSFVGQTYIKTDDNTIYIAYGTAQGELSQVDSNVLDDVTAAANLTDNAMVKGDGGGKGIQTTTILIDDSENITGINSLVSSSLSTDAIETLAYAGVTYTPKIFGTKSSATQVNLSLGHFSNNNTQADQSILVLGRGRGTKASKLSVQDNDYLGEVIFAGWNGTDWSLGGRIVGQVNGTPGDGDMPMSLLFQTSTDGTEVPTTKLEIDNAGKAYFTQGQGIYLDTDKDSYFYASADDVLDLYVNSVKMITFTEGLTYLKNNSWLSFLDYAGTGYLNTFKGNVDDEVDVGVQLNIDTIELEEDAGFVRVMDMPVSSASADGTKMALGFGIDGNNVFEIGAYADGAGGVDGEYIKVYGGFKAIPTTVTGATYTMLESDYIVDFTYTATGAVTITLPTALLAKYPIWTIKDAGSNAGTNNITIQTEGAETIDGSATYVINTDNSAVSIHSTGTNWLTH